MEIIQTVLLLIILALLVFKTAIFRRQRLTGLTRRRLIFIDTSTLMDGRILNVAKTNFLGDDFIIPRSVIREMQLLADGKDSEKRTRARLGLDVVSSLQKLDLSLEILPDELNHTPVDERLIELAHKYHGLILTNDFNLGKVATTESIDVLNINDLALSLRVEFLPGDQFDLKITAQGNSKKQGTGYLPDGTMVVVDNVNSKNIGKTIPVSFVRYLQTSSGRLMFAMATKKSKTKRNSNSAEDRLMEAIAKS